MPEKEGLPLEREVEQVEAVFREWRLYSKVVANNYLYHREVYARSHNFLLARMGHAFTLLDLECGDVGGMSHTKAPSKK